MCRDSGVYNTLPVIELDQTVFRQLILAVSFTANKAGDVRLQPAREV